jgi:DNA (cytosine-5)-methyltransferase 1
MKPRLLDLFCKAGGAARGYQRAGFYVVGVDIEPQPRYAGNEFIQADALTFSCGSFDAIHASPPCQAFTAYRRIGNGVGDGYPNLIAQVRSICIASGVPYVIENVEGAPLDNPILLCGSAFANDLRRHRLFETNFPVMSPGCAHGAQARDRFPGGRSVARTGTSTGLVRATIEIGSWDIPLSMQSQAMGIDWMNLAELSEAIPPVYTEHIGEYLMLEVRARMLRLAA